MEQEARKQGIFGFSTQDFGKMRDASPDIQVHLPIEVAEMLWFG